MLVQSICEEDKLGKMRWYENPCGEPGEKQSWGGLEDDRVPFWLGNETHSQKRQIGALLQEGSDRKADEI